MLDCYWFPNWGFLFHLRVECDMEECVQWGWGAQATCCRILIAFVPIEHVTHATSEGAPESLYDVLLKQMVVVCVPHRS